DHWQGGRADIVVQTLYNGQEFGCCLAAPDMTFHFGQLIAHLCKTRRAKAGTLVGSGTISNPGIVVNGQRQWPRGSSCIAERRSIETILTGKPTTPFMQAGDRVVIRARLPHGSFDDPLFGCIDQTVMIT
ncbi:MAG: fumarylacetoacetate hydrolase family protein, partial [Gammaproteobacteria bacterium]|nr:fumarylacetoacetate hydrolase family protein [Gammaproteobacteria bacterium]